MVMAKSADWVNDLVHLPNQHSVHKMVQFVEICFDLLVVKSL